MLYHVNEIEFINCVTLISHFCCFQYYIVRIRSGLQFVVKTLLTIVVLDVDVGANRKTIGEEVYFYLEDGFRLARSRAPKARHK